MKGVLVTQNLVSGKMKLSQIELVEEIRRLKKEKNAIILAHHYQRLEVQKIADFLGDSLQLAQEATRVENDIILFCGVRFMAETAKLLNPQAKVLLSNDKSGCPLADKINKEQLINFKAQYPGAKVICYVNSSLETKSESDICCTSSNAVKIVESFEPTEKLLFVPDKNLGTFAKNITARDIVVWQGYCNVHECFISIEDVKKAKHDFPDYKILIHPECNPTIYPFADLISSTKGIIDFAEKNDKVIIGTEIGVYDQLKDRFPDKKIELLSKNAICRNMKLTSLEDVYYSLKEEKNPIEIDNEMAVKALRCIENMLAVN